MRNGEVMDILAACAEQALLADVRIGVEGDIEWSHAGVGCRAKIKAKPIFGKGMPSNCLPFCEWSADFKKGIDRNKADVLAECLFADDGWALQTFWTNTEVSQEDLRALIAVFQSLGYQIVKSNGCGAVNHKLNAPVRKPATFSVDIGRPTNATLLRILDAFEDCEVLKGLGFHRDVEGTAETDTRRFLGWREFPQNVLNAVTYPEETRLLSISPRLKLLGGEAPSGNLADLSPAAREEITMEKACSKIEIQTSGDIPEVMMQAMVRVFKGLGHTVLTSRNCGEAKATSGRLSKKRPHVMID